MDDAKVEQVVELYEQGVPTADIVRSCGISAGSIYLALRRSGLNPSRQTRTWDKQVIELYRAGEPLADITKATGVPASLVYRHLRAAGLAPNRQQNQ